MNDRTTHIGNKRIKRTVISVRAMLALLLCLTLMPVQVLAEGDTAADNTTSDQTVEQTVPETTAETPAPTTTVKPQPSAKEVKWSGMKLKFTKTPVLTKKHLGTNSEPLYDKVKKVKKGRKITWKKPHKPDSIDGYVILRKTGKSKVYKEIARISPKKTKYTDKTAKKKKKYKYTVVGYKKVDGAIKISPCAGTGRAPGRKYQNPSRYVQITDKISKHGLKYYTSPVLVNKNSTKKQHIEALIKTAYKYKGDKYANRWSRKPGKGVDCSGLVMQACYGAGVDLWPSNPYRHRWGAAKYEWESREIAKNDKLKTVKYKNRKRGDLIFFCNSRGTIIHVAIYLGKNKIIHSTTVGGHVRVTGMGGGAYGRPCKVKRIFN